MAGVGTQVVFEDEKIKVWEFALKPGERTPLHTHELEYVFPGTGPLGPTCQNAQYGWYRKRSLFFLSPGLSSVNSKGGFHDVDSTGISRRNRWHPQHDTSPAF